MNTEIKVQVRIFAALRQALGTSSVTLELPSGATVAYLLERLKTDYPQASNLIARALVAVNQDYADQTRPLAAGDEIAVFPPVSGGAPERAVQEAVTFVALSPDPIDPSTVSEIVSEPAIGAIVSFTGLVRDNNLGREVRHLEYEAYPAMAETKMRQVAKEARERWPHIRGVAVVHRTGRLEIGEMAVFVAVGAPHRDDGAFEAARYIIDRTKEIVPIWKKEVWADGEEWLEGEYRPQPGE